MRLSWQTFETVDPTARTSMSQYTHVDFRGCDLEGRDFTGSAFFRCKFGRHSAKNCRFMSCGFFFCGRPAGIERTLGPLFDGLTTVTGLIRGPVFLRPEVRPGLVTLEEILPECEPGFRFVVSQFIRRYVADGHAPAVRRFLLQYAEDEEQPVLLRDAHSAYEQAVSDFPTLPDGPTVVAMLRYARSFDLPAPPNSPIGIRLRAVGSRTSPARPSSISWRQ